MPRACTRCFDETLLSGFLDGVITARERQIVRTHLIACAECRMFLSELGEIRQACLTTRFRIGRFALAGDSSSGRAELPSESRNREAGRRNHRHKASLGESHR